MGRLINLRAEMSVMVQVELLKWWVDKCNAPPRGLAGLTIGWFVGMLYNVKRISVIFGFLPTCRATIPCG